VTSHTIILRQKFCLFGNLPILKILFAESHTIFVRQAMSLFLSKHEVTVVPSLMSARDHLAAGPFDLLLVDSELDDGNGATLIRELRDAGNKIRIIGISAREEGNDSLLQAGADVICSKMEFNRIQEFI
jgi:DNA-binding response OmpR family regulator